MERLVEKCWPAGSRLGSSFNGRTMALQAIDTSSILVESTIMNIIFTPEEAQFVANLLINPDVANQHNSPIDYRALAYIIQAGGSITLNSQTVGVLQSILQEQAEINGSRRSVANEKVFMGPGTQFVPQRTLILIKSITDKLGATMSIDITTRTDTPDDIRAQGSPQILQDQRIKPVGTN